VEATPPQIQGQVEQALLPDTALVEQALPDMTLEQALLPNMALVEQALPDMTLEQALPANTALVEQALLNTALVGQALLPEQGPVEHIRRRSPRPQILAQVQLPQVRGGVSARVARRVASNVINVPQRKSSLSSNMRTRVMFTRTDVLVRLIPGKVALVVAVRIRKAQKNR
jgi:hypothetical protein